MPRAQYIAAGFTTDCENLIQAFIDTKSSTFEDFSRLWKEKQFSLVFYGRENETELAVFIHESFQVVLKYQVAAFSFHKKVGALFLLYSLYLKQPLTPKINIRVTLDQWLEILKLLNVASKEKHLDICYIINWLRLSNAFHFSARSKMMGPCSSDIADSEQDASSKHFNPLFAPLKSFLEEGFLEQLNTLHSYYQDLKENQDDPSVQSLNMISGNIISDFTKKIKDLHNRYSMPRADEGGKEAGNAVVLENLGERRARIRERQYTSKPHVSKSRRHRDVDASASDQEPSKHRTSRSRRNSRTEGSDGYSSGSHRSTIKKKGKGRRKRKVYASSIKKSDDSEESCN